MAKGADDVLEYVAAMFAFGHGHDLIQRKFGGQESFEFEFLHFALELLRTLLRLAFEFFDLFLHGRDGLLFFQDFKFERFLCFFFGLIPRGGEPFLYTFFHSEI